MLFQHKYLNIHFIWVLFFVFDPNALRDALQARQSDLSSTCCLTFLPKRSTKKKISPRRLLTLFFPAAKLHFMRRSVSFFLLPLHKYVKKHFAEGKKKKKKIVPSNSKHPRWHIFLLQFTPLEQRPSAGRLVQRRLRSPSSPTAEIFLCSVLYCWCFSKPRPTPPSFPVD